MRPRPRLLLFATLTATLTLLAAGPAAAHVTVNPSEAAKGGFTELTFRVPNEMDNASTTKLEVTFPTEAPIAFVSVRPLTGWTIDVAKVKLAQPVQTDDGEVTEAVSKLTWSGGKIAPSQYEDFSVSAGPLPEKVDQLVFKAVQTYSNGEVVRWIEEQTPGAAEPEHPAPVLTLTAPAGDQHASTPPVAAAAAPAADTASQAEVDSAKRLGLIGVAAGVIGLLVAVVALVAAGRRRGSAA